MSDAINTDLNSNLRLKRLLYQSSHRGCKETDAILGKFSEKNLPHFTNDEMNLYEKFINEDDWDIYAWIARKNELPEEHQNHVVEMILGFDFVNNE